MYSIIRQNDNTSSYITEFIVDTEADIKDLPTSVDAGSSCLVANNGTVYILNNAKVWTKL